MARKFLYVFAVLIVIAVALRLAYTFFGGDMMRMVMVPSGQFEAQPALSATAYDDPRMWIARPDNRGNPARWTPPGQHPAEAPAAAIFFIHPTSYIEPNPKHWNALLDDQQSNDRAALFVRGQASAFNATGAIWAPRYRQAAFGAFLTDQANAQRALDLAYSDVERAFAQFLKEAGDRPIILAAHSQGSLHLTRLLRDHVAGTPLAKRIVAAYVIGWPISETADLPRLGLPECLTPDQTGCILSWQSFGEPADPSLILDNYDRSTGFTGTPRKGSAMVCTNPLTGTRGGAAPASANRGTLVTSSDLGSGSLVVGKVPARCADRGLLLIGSPPDMGSSYVLPGNNYHVYDYSLFWANIRADVARRMAAFGKK